jgi:hypothetical protein
VELYRRQLAAKNATANHSSNQTERIQADLERLRRLEKEVEGERGLRSKYHDLTMRMALIEQQLKTRDQNWHNNAPHAMHPPPLPTLLTSAVGSVDAHTANQGAPKRPGTDLTSAPKRISSGGNMGFTTSLAPSEDRALGGPASGNFSVHGFGQTGPLSGLHSIGMDKGPTSVDLPVSALQQGGWQGFLLPPQDTRWLSGFPSMSSFQPGQRLAPVFPSTSALQPGGWSGFDAQRQPKMSGGLGGYRNPVQER